MSSIGEQGNEGSGSKEVIADVLEGSGASSGSGDGSDEDDDPLEMVHVDEDFYYMEHVMRLAALLHSIVSLAMLIAYYHLKVIFNVSRKFYLQILI